MSTKYCEQIGIGIIGYGKHLQRSHFLAQFCQETSYISVYGYFDPGSDQKIQEDFANVNPKPTKYDQLEDLLNDSRINTVFIGSPDQFHADQLAASIKAGKHVFVEKPLASCPEQIDSVKQSLLQANEKGLVVSTCHPRRTDHHFKYIKERFFPTRPYEFTTFDRMNLKKLLSIQYRFAYHELSSGDPNRQWKNERGLLVDHASHEIDLIHYLLPDVKDITPGCVIRDSASLYELFGTCKSNQETVSYHFIGHRFLEPYRFIEQLTLLFQAGEVHLNCETGELKVYYQNEDMPTSETIYLGKPNFDTKFRQLTENFFFQIRGYNESGCQEQPYVSDENIWFNVKYPFLCKYWSNFDNLSPI